MNNGYSVRVDSTSGFGRLVAWIIKDDCIAVKPIRNLTKEDLVYWDTLPHRYDTEDEALFGEYGAVFTDMMLGKIGYSTRRT